MPIEPDFVSDLNGTGDTTVSVHESDSAVHGADAVEINKGATREPVKQPTKVGAEPTDAEEAGKKPLSLRDQISSALKGETETPAVAAQDGLVRDPVTGKFAPKPATSDDLTDPALLNPAASAPVLAAPQGIDPEVFKSLPAETQATLARTMDDINARQQRFATLEPIEQLIAPRVQAWAMNGIAPAQALHQLLALSDFATSDAPGFIKYIAQQNNVDLEAMVIAGLEDGIQVDPAIAAMQREIAELRGSREREQQQQQQAAHKQTVDRVVGWATEKGQDGQPLRPYFEELGGDVMPFISTVKAQNPTWDHDKVLQEAYDRACWGSPTVRTKMQAAASAAGEAERLRASVEKVDKARTASASVRSGVPTSAPAAPDNPSRSLRDTIKASMAAAN